MIDVREFRFCGMWLSENNNLWISNRKEEDINPLKLYKVDLGITWTVDDTFWRLPKRNQRTRLWGLWWRCQTQNKQNAEKRRKITLRNQFEVKLEFVMTFTRISW